MRGITRLMTHLDVLRVTHAAIAPKITTAAADQSHQAPAVEDDLSTMPRDNLAFRSVRLVGTGLYTGLPFGTEMPSF